jgi:hypothetical protein
LANRIWTKTSDPSYWPKPTNQFFHNKIAQTQMESDGKGYKDHSDTPHQHHSLPKESKHVKEEKKHQKDLEKEVDVLKQSSEGGHHKK